MGKDLDERTSDQGVPPSFKVTREQTVLEKIGLLGVIYITVKSMKPLAIFTGPPGWLYGILYGGYKVYNISRNSHTVHSFGGEHGHIKNQSSTYRSFGPTTSTLCNLLRGHYKLN